MPSVPNNYLALRSLVNRSLADGTLRPEEGEKILNTALRDGVTRAEVSSVVDAFVQSATQGSLDLSGPEHRATINRLLTALAEHQPLPQALEQAPVTATGQIDYAAGLFGLAPVPTEPLPQKSFAGRPLAATAEGELALNGRRLLLDPAVPSKEAVEALWGLARPEQAAQLPAATQGALCQRLSAFVAEAARVDPSAPGKFERGGAMAAALRALASMAPALPEESAAQLLSSFEKLSSPMLKSLALRTLEDAPLHGAQARERRRLPEPEAMSGLSRALDELLAERAGSPPVRGAAAELCLSAMAFAVDGSASDNLRKVLGRWDSVAGDVVAGDGLGDLRETLADYVAECTESGLSFARFVSELPKAKARITSRQLFEELSPRLEAEPPRFGDQVLTRAQADFLAEILPDMRDRAAAECCGEALAAVASLFPGRETIPQTAWRVFEREASAYQDEVSDSSDGKLGYEPLREQVAAVIQELAAPLAPRLEALAQAPATWGEVELSAQAATTLRQLLEDRVASPKAVERLDAAVATLAAANGGSLAGEGGRALVTLCRNYLAPEPAGAVLQLRGLDSLAKAQVEGRSLELRRLNGERAPISTCADQVGRAVTRAIDASNMRHAWQPERWGMRARALAQKLDVVAERFAAGEGTLARLAELHPGCDLTVQGTGADGAHEQFVYVVQKDGETIARYTAGSDNTFVPYHKEPDPLLFAARVSADGELAYDLPSAIPTRRFPMMKAYDVGDEIDLAYEDPHASEQQKENRPFSTRHKIVPATIEGFDGEGNYTVRLRLPGGGSETRTVGLSTIKRLNNPHYFSLRGSTFEDVKIDLRHDETLEQFLEGCRPIIERHLPVDGSLLTLETTDLRRKQRACIEEVMAYTRERVVYPEHGRTKDDASREYHKLEKGPLFPLGEIVRIERGVCRHQCILEQLILQLAGIDSRLATGAANTREGDFRGYHVWCEVMLAGGERFLSDQTWDDVAIPLWREAYGKRVDRVEMSNMSDDCEQEVVNL